MKALQQLQNQFSQMLLADEHAQQSIMPQMVTQLEYAPDSTTRQTNNLGKLKRLAVYKNNRAHSLQEYLASSFPVVLEVVGKDFFNAMAKVFSNNHPPKSAMLIEFALVFPEFLKEFEPVQMLPYIADLAALELAWVHSYAALDHAVFSPQEFSKIEQDQLLHSPFQLHPSVQLLSSNYAVANIWSGHQAASEKDIVIDYPQQVLIWRSGDGFEQQVQVSSIAMADYLFLEYLKSGESFLQSMERVQLLNAEWQPTTILAQSIQFGLFCKPQVNKIN